MDRISAPPQNALLGRLADLLRLAETGAAGGPEFLPKGLDVMNLVRQLALPSAETVEKLSYGDPLFRMAPSGTGSRIPMTTDREYLADVAGMVPIAAPAARPSARGMQELVRQIQTEPPTGAISPEIAARVLPQTKVVDEAGKPVMVYTGSQNEIEKFTDGTDILKVASGWFTDKPKLASAYAVDPTRAARGERSPTVYPSYLDIKNPLVVDAKGSNWNKIKIDDKKIAKELEIDAPVSTDFLAYLAKQKGYDGVIIKNVKDNPNATTNGLSDVYAPFKSEQIRSATSDPQMAGLLDEPAQSVAEAPIQRAFTTVSPGDEVAGLTVREDVPNMSSIGATIENYEILQGIRKVPRKAFDEQYLNSLDPAKLDKRTSDLSEQIKQSKEINPLIVAIDNQGAYIIEGGHRFDALMTQKRESVPAVVVIDKDNPPTEEFLQSLLD